MATNQAVEGSLAARHSQFINGPGRIEAERLIALAIDMLEPKRDQIARDHLGLALDALQFCREDGAEARYCSRNARNAIAPEAGTSANDFPDCSTQPAESK